MIISDARLNAISSVDLPSHNTRWTSEEDDRLREGIVSRHLIMFSSQSEIIVKPLTS